MEISQVMFCFYSEVETQQGQTADHIQDVLGAQGGPEHPNSASHSQAGMSSYCPAEKKTQMKQEFEVKLRQNALPKYSPTHIGSLLTVCGKEEEELHGHNEIGSAPCAIPFFRSHDSPGSTGHQLIQCWKFCSLLKAVRNSEQLKDEPHFQLLSSQVIFCTPLHEFKTVLCSTL